MARQVIRGIAVCLLVLFAVMAAAQEQEQYLDVYRVQVKPEKRAEFDALSKKVAEANRKNGGDMWVTTESMYGEGNIITFISTRSSYGDVEKGMNSFMGSMAKTFGPEQMMKMMGDWSTCVNWSRGELRRRRWDLSSNAPKDAAALAKMVGEARYLRTTRIVVRSGRGPEFEAMVKQIKAAREKAAPNDVTLVSQVVAGEEGTVYYVTMLAPSLGAYDSVVTQQKLLGDEDYQKWLKSNADVVETVYTTIHRFVPDTSNPPTEVAAASPDFWNPKPVVAQKKPAAKKSPKADGQ
jgi:hypothetical protein